MATDKKEDSSKFSSSGAAGAPSSGSSSPSSSSSSPRSSDDISIDFSSLITPLKKLKNLVAHRSAILTDILLLIPLILTIIIHAQPLLLSVTDDWAANSLDSSIRSQLAQKIDQQYGQLPDESKQRIMGTELQKFMEENKRNYELQHAAIRSEFKNRFSAPDGTPYLIDIDSYLWLRKAENILKNGHIGTEIRNGRIFDSYLVAPLGDFTAQNWHPYVIATLYILLSFFNSSITLMYAQAIVPIIIAALAVLFAFLTVRKLTNSWGGFFAALLVAAHPVIASRTTSTDTDSYTVLFHFLIFWLFLEAITASSPKKQAAWGIGVGAAVSVFSMFWEGWWYSFDVLILVLAGGLVYYTLLTLMQHGKSAWPHLRKKPEIRTILIVLAAVVVASFIFISLLRGPAYYISMQTAPFIVPKTLTTATHATLWPNVYTTVAELNKISVSNILPQIGGGIMILLMFLGLVLLILPRRRPVAATLAVLLSAGWYSGIQKFFIDGTFSNVKLLAVLTGIPVLAFVLFSLARRRELSLSSLLFSFLFTIWLGAMFYASTNGIRFVVQILVASSLLVGIALGTGITYFQSFFKTLFEHKLACKVLPWLRLRNTIQHLLILLALLAIFSLFTQPIKAGFSTGRGQLPLFDDGWYNTLTKIKAESAPDAILTSWWDFGHYFKAVGDRRVTFDGGTQNRPQAHWVGRLLMANDEKESLAILRMLNCGGNTAYELLQEELGDPLITIRFLNGLLAAGKEKGTALLNSNSRVSAGAAQSIAERLYCVPPESYLITSEDMRGKSGVWAHFGSWSFERSKIWLETRNKSREQTIAFLTKELNYTQARAEETAAEVTGITGQNEANTWIAPWPSYFGTGVCRTEPAAENTSESILCVNQLNNNQQLLFRIDPTTKEVFIENHNSRAHPAVFVWSDESGFHVKRYETNTLDIALGFRGDSNLLMASELGGSLFTRLFFFNGAGSRYFKPFFKEQSGTTGQLLVWNVDWDA